MDLYTNSTSQVQKGREIGSRDHMTQFRNFVTLITFVRLELFVWNWCAVKQLLTHSLTCFKFDMHIKDGPLLCMDHKMTLIGCGWGNVTQFQNFTAP